MSNFLRKYLPIMGMALLAQADYMFDEKPQRSSVPRQLTDKEKYRLHAIEKSKWHEFIINGEVVKARSKKDARKIYNKRHNIKK